MSKNLFEEARKVLTQEAAVKLDPVGQEDKDIDNNGKVDKTDSYLKKRRGAISAAIAQSKNESSLSDDDILRLKFALSEVKKTEVVSESDLPKSKAKEKTITVKHKTSGKEKVIVDNPAARRMNAEMGYHPVKEEVEQVAEAKTLIGTYNHPEKEHTTKVYKLSGMDNEGDDYHVKLFKSGKHYEPADYFTDDKEDAHSTAKRMVKEGFAIDEAEHVDEGRYFRTAYGYAGGSRPGGGTYKHPEQIKADREAKKKAKEQEKANKNLQQGVEEEVEQIDELSKETLKSYQDKAIKTPPSKKGSWVNRIQGVGRAEVKMKKEEVEQIDEISVSKLNKYIPAARAQAENPETPTATALTRYRGLGTAIKKKYSDLYNVKVPAKANEETTLEDDDFELIEKIEVNVPSNPTFEDYFRAALKIAKCESISDLSQDEQEYIISEMEQAFDTNDVGFIIEADNYYQMQNTADLLARQGHTVDTGRDYQGNPFYLVTDKTTGIRRKVTYKGDKKLTQNMGRSKPGDEKESQ